MMIVELSLEKDSNWKKKVILCHNLLFKAVSNGLDHIKHNGNVKPFSPSPLCGLFAIEPENLIMLLLRAAAGALVEYYS